MTSENDRQNAAIPQTMMNAKLLTASGVVGLGMIGYSLAVQQTYPTEIGTMGVIVASFSFGLILAGANANE